MHSPVEYAGGGGGAPGPGTVTNTMLANMPARTVKTNATNASAAPQDLAGAGAGTILSDTGTALAFQTRTALAIAGTDLANTFSQPQIVNTNVLTASGYQVEIQNSDPGAFGPFMTMFHNSASPAVSDTIGGYDFFANDAAAAKRAYGGVRCYIDATTAAAVNGKVTLEAVRAGSFTQELTAGGGVKVGAPTGGVLGIGTLSVASVVRPGQFTVATLPSAATMGDGARASVTDALAPTFGATVAAGGAIHIPVYSDGSNWKVG